MNSFHFTIGPVQGFVAQARRTRDFWAGSFLLSWLSGVAMAAVEAQGGEIVFPRPPAGYLAWITGQGQGEAPTQGAIPNRFKANVPEGFDAERVVQTVRQAWIELADRVWNQDLKGVVPATTREIWDRQHANFWEISWVVTDSPDTDLVDRRKNWRTLFYAPEPGDKCMVMDGWQELSGAIRPHPTVQDTFWAQVREQNQGLKNDLRKGERLSGLAFVKRRFARHFNGLDVTIHGVRIRGWALPVSVPSVSYMAAVHWLEKLLDDCSTAQVQQVLQVARAVEPAQDEWSSQISCLVQAVESHHGREARRLIALDAAVFFEHVRHNQNFYPDQEPVQALDRQLSQLELDAPLSPFYAILLMDGDSLGAHMSNPANQQPIANALNQFTAAVQQVVKENNGFLIFAGGDDVLAILPLEDAFPCALELRNAYASAFSTHAVDISSTLSGAIEFAHVKIPLGHVLRDAHDLIDNVAKDGSGRDAIAARIWKPGGNVLTWSQPWHVALRSDGDGQEGAAVLVQQIAATFGEWDAESGDVPYSNKFLYRIRELFDLLNPSPGAQTAVLNAQEAVTLLAAEYLSSGINEKRAVKLTLTEAETAIAPLLYQCRPVTREKQDGDDPPTFSSSQRLEADGSLLVRFLAHKGVERGGER